MKKILIFSIALMLFSCSPDDSVNEPVSCTCNKIIEQRVHRINAVTLETIVDTGYQPAGLGVVSTDITDCERDEEIVFNRLDNAISSGISQFLYTRHTLNCF